MMTYLTAARGPMILSVLGRALSVLALLVVPAILGGENLSGADPCGPGHKAGAARGRRFGAASTRTGCDRRATTCLADSNRASQPAS